MLARHRDDAQQAYLLVAEAQRGAGRLAGKAASLRLGAIMRSAKRCRGHPADAPIR